MEEVNSTQPEDGPQQEVTYYTWILDSPRAEPDADVTKRLLALANVIEPFGEKLLQLPPQFKRRVEILYHKGPDKKSNSETEKERLRLPASLMESFARWGLDLVYDVAWSNDAKRPVPEPPGLLRRVTQMLGKESGQKAEQG